MEVETKITKQSQFEPESVQNKAIPGSCAANEGVGALDKTNPILSSSIPRMGDLSDSSDKSEAGTSQEPRGKAIS